MTATDSGVLSDIQAELSRIEREENVRILYACESGSRAWDFLRGTAITTYVFYMCMSLIGIYPYSTVAT